MATLVGIVGESGTGKSRSALDLNPKETFIINVQGKALPWRGSASSYNVETNKNIANIDSWLKVHEHIIGVASNRPEIKTIFIDDAGFIMATEYFKRASETGYGKFSEIGQHMFNIIDSSKKLRDDLKIVFTFHPETETDLLGQTRTKIKTIGKLLDNSYTLEASLPIVLYTEVSFDKDGAPIYQFVTNRTQTCPAKSPEGMFDNLKIENNLKTVIDAIDQYYK